MALRIPKVILRIDEEDEFDLGAIDGEAFGLALLALVALGVAQGDPTLGELASPSALRTCCCVASAVALMGGGLLDKSFHSFYRKRRSTLLGASLLVASILPVALALVAGFGAGLVARSVAGLMMGAGCGLLVFSWGISFARRDIGDIVLNSLAGIALAAVAYAVVLSRLPDAWGLMLACALQALHIPLLRRRVTYDLPDPDMRYAAYFSELSIKRGAYLAKYVPAMLCLGLACGSVMQHAGHVMRPAAGAGGELASVAAALAGTLLVLGGWLVMRRREQPFSRLFRQIMPLTALLLLPMAADSGTAVASASVLTALVMLLNCCWAIMGTTSQGFRLSPVFLFGFGAGSAVLGYLLADPLRELTSPMLDATMSDPVFGLVVCLFCLVVACGLFPRREDILTIVLSSYRPSALWGADAMDDGACAHCARGIARACEATAAEGAAGETTRPELPSSHGGTPYREPSPLGSADEAERGEVRKGRFVRRCECVADTYLLSRRETDVLFLLAKGRNVSFICDELCISEGTAKTHVSHVYKKLGVHSRQELIALIDSFDAA